MNRYGRNCYDKIASEIKTKTQEEVEIYSKVFWERVKDMPNGTLNQLRDRRTSN